MLDPDVDANHRSHTVAGWEMPLDLDGKGNEPAVGLPIDRGGDYAGGPLFQATGQLASRLMGLEDTDLGKLHVLAVG